MSVSAHPLQWPDGWKRTATAYRRHAMFSTGRHSPATARGTAQKDLTIADGLERVLAALGRMGVGRNMVVISSNLLLRQDGLPRSGQPEPADVGVAVYWTSTAGIPKVMAIDQYRRVADNLAAVAATLEAMRAVQRHGGGAILDRAFTGFTALPAPGQTRGWRETLDLVGVDPISEQVLKERFRHARSAAHPQNGGSSEAFMAAQAAYDSARKALGFLE